MKKNPKRLFSYINQNQSISKAIRGLFDSSGSTKTNQKDIADILIQHFESVFDKTKSLFHKRTNDAITDIDITERKVKDLLEGLDPNKSQGYDRVHPRVLKECASDYAIPLAIIFKTSLATRTVPQAWILANVSPVFKKGSTLDPNNYRQISLTSVVCKLMEKLVKHEIVIYCIRNKLFSDSQHGFVPNKPCITNLLESLDMMTKNLDSKVEMDLIFLDFAKAFDKVNHQLLAF